ncbi:MAG: DUF2304 family protein [Candidatus Eisenbacteria bacterium]
MLLCWILAAAAMVLVVVSFAGGRRGRLSLGHATAWMLIALSVLAASVAGLVVPALLRATVPAFFALLVAVMALAAAGVSHSAALTRLDGRMREMAQAMALLQTQVDPGRGTEAADRGRPEREKGDEPSGAGRRSVTG